MDAARGKPVGPARVEGLDRDQQLAVWSTHRHQDFSEPVFPADRVIEAVVDVGVEAARLAVAPRKLIDLATRVGWKLHRCRG
jgi:hypothetical protein